MKHRLNSLLIGGIIMLVIGIAALALGLNVRSKYSNMRDLSEVTLADIHKGMYIKGRINEVVSGLPRGKADDLENGYATEPFDLYTTESQDTEEDANVSYVLAEVGPVGSGEYVCLIIDEFSYTDLYWHIFGGNMTNNAYDNDSFEFEGVVTCDDSDAKIVKDKVENWGETYSYLAIGRSLVGSVDTDHVSDCCIRLKDLSTRRYYWLFGLPPIAGGIVLLLIGLGSSAEDEKGRSGKSRKDK